MSKIRYNSYDSKTEKYYAYFAALPLVTVVPLFQMFQVLCTFFIQLRTYADVGESFDPKFGNSLYGQDNGTSQCNSYCQKGIKIFGLEI